MVGSMDHLCFENVYFVNLLWFSYVITPTDV